MFERFHLLDPAASLKPAAAGVLLLLPKLLPSPKLGAGNRLTAIG
jgi:hypothetical protein